MAERKGNKLFWKDQENKLVAFECVWKAVGMLSLDCSNGGVLDGEVESSFGNRLILAGPVYDDFLMEIGVRIQAKLSKGKLTGLLPPVNIFVPPSIMSKIFALCVGYGGEMNHEYRGNGKRKKAVKTSLTITGKRSASSIFHPTRFNGTNFLKKRFFRTVIDPYSKKKKKAYNGNAEVVISGRTPFILEYDYRNSHLNVSFYVQRYN